MQRSQIFPDFAPKGRRARVSAWLLGPPAALAVGTGMRLWYYFLNDSFWRDETMLLMNVAQKSFTGLLGPLEYAQEAPIPLLWFYRLLFLLGGGGELPMRALSLISSILALFLFYYLARRVLTDRPGVLFSTWLMALAPGVILFAAQTKPYSLDLLVATGLLFLAVPWLIEPVPGPPGGLEAADSMAATRRVGAGGNTVQRPPAPASNSGLIRPPSISRLAGAAGLAPWFSLSAVFVAGGIGVGLLCRARRVGLRPALIFIMVVALSFSLEFFLILKRSQDLTAYLQEWFFTFTWSGLRWTYSQVFFAYLGPQGHPWSWVLMAVAALMVLGLVEAVRLKGPAWAIVLLAPLVLALLAGIFHIIPIFGRLLLFATPGLYLLAGYGAAILWRKVPWPQITALGLAALVLVCARTSLTTFARAEGGVREALEFIAAKRQPSDLVLGDCHALPTLAYYGLLGRPFAINLNCPLDLGDWCWGKVHPSQLNCQDLMPLIPPGRPVWLVAENLDYVRTGVREVLPYWQELTTRLEKERQLTASFTNERAQARQFSPGLPKPAQAE